jgi:hypothetical protein
MAAGRLRLGPAADWTAAAVFLLATVGVTLLILRAFTAIDSPANRQPAQSTTPAAVPAALPALSIPVSLLNLPNNRQLRLGDRLEDVALLLGREAETGAQVVEEGRTGLRVTRGYEYANLRFTIVFEPFERNGEFRIAGIYLQ